MSKTRIVIIGGGFAGVECAQVLCQELSATQAEVVLFNNENHMVFSPLLAEVVGSSISPMDVIVPLRQMLPRVLCRMEQVQQIDLAGSALEYFNDSEQTCRMPYDHLVIACGNVTNLCIVPGMADHGFPLKTVGDAADLRSHIIEQMEKAEVCSSPERRKWHLSFIIVGGGFSGAEAAGEINDLVRSSAKYFHGFRPEDVSVTLLHSRDQLLPEISPGLRQFAQEKMQKAGVKIILNARVAAATPEGVSLQGGAFIQGGTIVCTVGSSINPLIERLAVPKEKGRLLTEPDMRVSGYKNSWSIGDCALITNAYDHQPCPTTGQFAERQGKQCALNIVRVISGRPTKPFAFKALGELCSIGGHSAVADLLGFHISGFMAWFVWRGVYLFKLPTWARRFQVGFDWAWLVLFPRDLAHVRTTPTDRVSHAHYQPGDYIVRRGEAPTNFYVIEQGEVEVVRSNAPDGKGEVVNVLGPGSFLGEKALLSNEPRLSSARARTDVQVLVMGKNVLTQMSAALSPLRDALAQTLNQRAVDPWKDRPEIYALLARTPVRQLLEPVPLPLLKPTASFREVGEAFVQYGHEFFYVSGDGETLEGIVTITDLIRSRTNDGKPSECAADFMTSNPIALSLDDNCAVAANVLREHRLKNLPIVQGAGDRKLAGCLRVRRLMAYVFKERDKERERAPLDSASPATELEKSSTLPQGA